MSEVREVIAAWAKAIRAGDLEGTLARHSDDVVFFDVAPPVSRRGLKAFREAWVPFLDGGPHKSFELAELTVHTSGDVAFAHALAHVDGDDGFSVRITLGLVKQAGEWTIAHEHHSAPSV